MMISLLKKGIIKDLMKFAIGGLAKPKEKISVGLDIGSQSIKCVKILYAKSGPELVSFAQEEAPADIGRSLADFARSQNIKLANVSLSGPSTLIRYVGFPRMDVSELRQALKFEAQKHIPFPVADVNLDGYILEPDLPDNKMLVLLAAVKKDTLAQRLKLIEDAGIRAGSLDVDSVALINAYNYNYPPETEGAHKAAALLNIGASMTNLNILEKGSPRLSRDIHIGGAAITRKLSEIFAIEFGQAEKLKLEPEGERKDKITAVMEAMISNLCLEIRTSFDFYESQSAVSVGKIFVSGGSCCFSGLKEMVASSVGVPVESWDPFKNIIKTSSIDAQELEKVYSRLAVAAGLALRS